MKKGESAALILSLLLCLSLAVATSALNSSKAYADGLSQESLPGIPVNGKVVNLFVKINPTVIQDNNNDKYIQLELRDAYTNIAISHTTYNLTVTRLISNSEFPENDPSNFNGTIHSHVGPLKIEIKNNNSPYQNRIVRSNFDKAIDSWIADQNGTVNLEGPLLFHSGLYHFHIEILGFEHDATLLSPSHIPKFDAWLSLGGKFKSNISTAGRDYNLTMISYYDNVNNFHFDSKREAITWSIPFSWNLRHLEQNNIFIHQEIIIPKSLIRDVKSTSFSPYVDGFALNNNAVVLDPFSYENDMAIHYMISKDSLEQIASLRNQSTSSTGGLETNNSITDRSLGNMTFGLLLNFANRNQTTTSLDTYPGDGALAAQTYIPVRVSWSPTYLNANSQANATITFINPNYTPIQSDIMFEMRITDSSGQTLLDRSNLTATEGTSIQPIVFPRDGVYNLALTVWTKNNQSKGVTNIPVGVANQRDQIKVAETATGFIVVPEFGSNVILIAAFCVIPLLLAMLIRKKHG